MDCASENFEVLGGFPLQVTVVMGACTTLCSGCCLWLCTLTFFTKFAVLVVSTIGFSLAYALFFFMPLLALVGPQGDCCDVVELGKTMCGKTKNGVAAVDQEEKGHGP